VTHLTRASTKTHSNRSISGRFTVPLLAAAGLVVLAIAVLNLTVLPRAVERARTAVAGIALVEVGRACYLPFIGVVLKETRATFPDIPGAVLSADRVSAGLTASYALSLSGEGGNSLPPRIAAHGVSLAIDGERFSLEPIRINALHIRRHSGDGTITADATGPGTRLSMTVPGRSHGSSPPEGSDSSELVRPPAAGAGPALPALDADVRISGPGFDGWGLSGRLSADLHIEERPADWLVAGSVGVDDLSINVAELSSEVMAGNSISYRFTADLSPHVVLPPPYLRDPLAPTSSLPRGRLRITSGSLTVNGITARLAADVAGVLRGPVSVELAAGGRSVPVNDVIHAAPPELSGDLANAEVEGTADFSVALLARPDSLSSLRWQGSLQVNDFAVLSIPESINVFKLNGPFEHEFSDTISGRRAVRIPEYQPVSMEWMLMHSEHSASRIIATMKENAEIAAVRPEPDIVGETDRPVLEDGPGRIPIDDTFDYVRLDDMSPWIVRAVLTGEDGDFFFYRGINPVTLADAIEINLEAGEILFGASTISMQLVKLLFLDMDRIFSRKLQELFLTFVMEQHVPVPKDRILELYLNLAEFGPGIYGVAQAARYHFNTDPASLSAAQATWLASILPAPGLWSLRHTRGIVSEEQMQRVNRLYAIMLERGRMTAEEYETALANPPVVLSPGEGG